MNHSFPNFTIEETNAYFEYDKRISFIHVEKKQNSSFVTVMINYQKIILL